MKDKLGDLIPWLEKLQDTLAKVNPDNDREEVERRSQLAKFVSRLKSLVHPKLNLCDRSLEDIGKRSLVLSDKGKVARVLDKTRDLQEVIGLVEKLQQASYPRISGQYRRCEVAIIGDRLTGVIDVATAVNIQPGRPTDREFMSLIPDFETKLVAGRFKSSFDILLKLHQVRQRVCITHDAE